jgi:hypothetical protein
VASRSMRRSVRIGRLTSSTSDATKCLWRSYATVAAWGWAIGLDVRKPFHAQ